MPGTATADVTTHTCGDSEGLQRELDDRAFLGALRESTFQKLDFVPGDRILRATVENEYFLEAMVANKTFRKVVDIIKRSGVEGSATRCVPTSNRV